MERSTTRTPKAGGTPMFANLTRAVDQIATITLVGAVVIGPPLAGALFVIQSLTV